MGSLVVLVECEDYESSKRFAEDLAAELQSEVYTNYVNYVDYNADVDFFRENALLYMDFEDLEEIQFRIEDRIAEEKLKLSPLHISLGDEEEELDFQISRKSTRKNGMGRIRFIRIQNEPSWRWRSLLPERLATSDSRRTCMT